MTDIVCAVCGKTVQPTSGRQKYCPECGEKKRLEASQRQTEERKKATAARKAAKLQEKAETPRGKKMLACAHCGKEIPRTGGNWQKYCPECAVEVEWQRVREREERRRAALAELRAKNTETTVCARCGKTVEKKREDQKYCLECRKELYPSRYRGEKLPEERFCAGCGAKIENPKPNQRFCEACKVPASLKRAAEYNAGIKKRDRTKPPELKKKDYAFLTPCAAPEGWSLKGKSADQVNVEAGALGLSYGQYSSYVNSGFIERYCRDNGMDGLAVTKKAWDKYRREHRKTLKKAG